MLSDRERGNVRWILSQGRKGRLLAFFVGASPSTSERKRLKSFLLFFLKKIITQDLIFVGRGAHPLFSIVIILLPCLPFFRSTKRNRF